MIIGTNHFVTKEHAARYYYEQGITKTVGAGRVHATKLLNDGVIFAGHQKPILRLGEKLIVVDNGTRYAIKTYDKPEEVEIMKK